MPTVKSGAGARERRGRVCERRRTSTRDGLDVSALEGAWSALGGGGGENGAGALETAELLRLLGEHGEKMGQDELAACLATLLDEAEEHAPPRKTAPQLAPDALDLPERLTAAAFATQVLGFE